MPADSACSKTAVNSIELHQQEEKLEQKHLPRRTRLDAGRIPWVSQSLQFPGRRKFQFHHFSLTLQCQLLSRTSVSVVLAEELRAFFQDQQYLHGINFTKCGEKGKAHFCSCYKQGTECEQIISRAKWDFKGLSIELVSFRQTAEYRTSDTWLQHPYLGCLGCTFCGQFHPKESLSRLGKPMRNPGFQVIWGEFGYSCHTRLALNLLQTASQRANHCSN